MCWCFIHYYLPLFPTNSEGNIFRTGKYLTSQSRWPLAYWNCRFESCRGHWCLRVVSFVCCQVEVSAMGRSLFQRGPTEHAFVTECDLETSTRKPRHTRARQEPVRLFASCVLVSFLPPARVACKYGLAGAYWRTFVNLSLYNRNVHTKLSSAVETSLVSWLPAAVAMVIIRDVQFAVTHAKHDFSSARLLTTAIHVDTIIMITYSLILI